MDRVHPFSVRQSKRVRKKTVAKAAGSGYGRTKESNTDGRTGREDIFSKDEFPGKFSNCVLTYTSQTEEDYINWVLDAIRSGDTTIEPVLICDSNLRPAKIDLEMSEIISSMDEMPDDFTGDSGLQRRIGVECCTDVDGDDDAEEVVVL